MKHIKKFNEEIYLWGGTPIILEVDMRCLREKLEEKSTDILTQDSANNPSIDIDEIMRIVNGCKVQI